MTRRYLFLCIGNSCRSQMAEGFARHYAASHRLDIEVQSGGTVPSGRVDPDAVRVMAERGIDISDQTSGPMDLGFAEQADRILTMGCSAEDACPARLFAKIEDWGLDDPVGQDLETFRRVRDEIDGHVRTLLGIDAPDLAPASRGGRST